jgi:hypothetical protein
MMNIEVLSVRNPMWADVDHSAINCRVRFGHLIDEVPFTAALNDSEPHGREIYARCLKGEFGEIGPLSPQMAVTTPPQAVPPPKMERLQQFLCRANDENAKKSAVGIVSAWSSKLDDVLKHVVDQNARRNSDWIARAKNERMTLNERIEKVVALGLVDQYDEKKLHCLRLVRNQAAHRWDFSLESKDVRTSLSFLYQADHSRHLVFSEDFDYLIRLVYAPSCAMMVMKLMALIDD